MLTEAQSEQAYEVKEALHDAIHELINEYVEGLNDEQEQQVRNQLHDEFRFWKQS